MLNSPFIKLICLLPVSKWILIWVATVFLFCFLLLLSFAYFIPAFLDNQLELIDSILILNAITADKIKYNQTLALILELVWNQILTFWIPCLYSSQSKIFLPVWSRPCRPLNFYTNWKIWDSLDQHSCGYILVLLVDPSMLSPTL